MAKREEADEVDDQRRLRLDIHLNLQGIADGDGPLAWLSQYAKSPGEQSPRATLVDLAGKLYNSRRLRDRFLSNSLLGEPVWDMLLALYCFSASGKVLSVSGLCHSAGVPQTTALRWMQVMEQKKLIRRSKDLTDGRRTLISMTDETRHLLDGYLATLKDKDP